MPILDGRHILGPNLDLPNKLTQEKSLESDALARLVFEAMGDKQGEDLVILDIRPVSSITDYFVIATAASQRQLKAVMDGVADALSQTAGIKARQVEGEPESGWVLMDLGDVVVHVFDPERREFYALEELWDEAPLVVRMR